MVTIDWTPFDALSEYTNTCRCGTVFRSHVKTVNVGGMFRTIARKPCPRCGASDNVWRSSSDVETMTITGSK
jgi:hypothetical protein